MIEPEACSKVTNEIKKFMLQNFLKNLNQTKKFLNVVF